MCRYSVTDGFVGEYHLAHPGRFALGGFGLVIVAAAGVTPEGRMATGTSACGPTSTFRGSPGWSTSCTRRGRRPDQPAHAGAKASSLRPWDDTGPVTTETARPGEASWPTVSVSAVPAGPGRPTPPALTVAELAEVRDAFVAATGVQVRAEAELPTVAVGLIVDAHQAEAIVADGSADLVAIAREAQDDPNFAPRRP
jgi:2,4-dienoyl-CoA reductase-like NADH-dependent reductase (Old Yellow Enzyme family)